jgi:hypothetical protein
MLGVFLSLFKTVDLSARHFRHRRRRPHSCSPQQHQIRSDVWYSSRTKFSPKLIGPAETTEVCSSRRRSRQSSTKPLSSCIRRATSSQSRFLWRWGSRFVKRRARSISAPTFSTSTLDNAERFLAPDRLMRRRGPCSQWAVCPSIVSPRISRKLATKSCEISSRRKHGH